jgi:hypothetical protein
MLAANDNRTGRPPTGTEMMNAAKPTPWETEIKSGRISWEFEVTIAQFARDHQITLRHHGGTPHPKNNPPDALLGPEIAANASLACRFVATRLGHLYKEVLVPAIVLDARMSDLAGLSDETSRNDAAAKIGGQRFVDALRLVDGAYLEWDALKKSLTGQATYALGEMGHAMPAHIVQAANDNAKAAGNSALRGLHRTYRYNEPALAVAVKG